MKKFFAFALSLAAAGSLCAQKTAVDQAAKLGMKDINQARTLLKGAMDDAATKNDAKTYYTAGKLEFEVFDEGQKKSMINPNDPSVDNVANGRALLDGYKYFLQALPLDSLPNEKGQVKPKYSKDIIGKIAGHSNDFWIAGANFFNGKAFFPEAYEAFMVYGDLPKEAFLGKDAPNLPDSTRSVSYFNAGLAAYSGQHVAESAKAFKKAREAGYDKPEAYIYEIACWQNMAQKDTTLVDQAQKEIASIARAGYDKFGMAQPVFVNNLVNDFVLNQNFNGAYEIINAELAKDPNNAAIYGLAGFVYDRAGNEEKSLESYRKAATLPNVDYETLKNASKKLYRSGTEKLNSIQGNDDAAKAARQDVKVNYLEAAKAMTDKAKQIQTENDNDLNYVIESIQYALDTYF